MTSPNPYSPSIAPESEPDSGETPSTRRLWIAYGIAPMVAPLAAASVVFILALSYQAANPDDVEVNPMAIVLAPIGLLLVGLPASYCVAGIIGMPIAFWLRKHHRLNAGTIHGAAFLWVLVLAFGVTIVAQIRSFGGALEILAGSFFLTLLLTPFVLLSATVFWLIGVRRSNRLA